MAPPDGPPAVSSRTFMSTDVAFPNPERGGCVYVDHFAFSSEGVFADIRSRGYALACANVRLDEYQKGPIDRDFLTRLEEGFGRARQAGIKLVLRFRYSDDRDAPLGSVLRHIDQLSPVLKKGSDVIAVLQAGFIGDYGEWHSSRYGLDEEAPRKKILTKLLAIAPASRAVELRKPEFKAWALSALAMVKPPLDSRDLAPRLGHHNDCLGASATDAGTYPSDAIEEWKSFIENDLPATPVGGETCPAQGERMTCAAAEREMRRLRWSHINVTNEAYDGGTIAGWKADGCWPTILRDLGYRLVLNRASWDAHARDGTAIRLRVNLINRGYAAPFNERPVYAVVEGAGIRFAAKLPVDVRTWKPGQPVEILFDLGLPQDIPAGTYRLALWLPDPSPALQDDPRYAIRFNNDGTWQGPSGYNVLTEELAIGAGGGGPPKTVLGGSGVLVQAGPVREHGTPQAHLPQQSATPSFLKHR